MNERIVIFAFQGEPSCFAHALLNTLDLQQRGADVRLVIEGSATALLPGFADDSGDFLPLFKQVQEAGLIDAVCRACAAKTGGLDAAEELGLPVSGEMSGHPPMGRYIDIGYRVITL